MDKRRELSIKKTEIKAIDNTELKELPFNFLKRRLENKQTIREYDKEKIVMIKAGKKININQLHQENNMDCEIYPTMEKYGTIEKLMVSPNIIVEGFDEIDGLRGALEIENKAKELWQNLPNDVREEFDHSRHKFIDKGRAWAEQKVKEMKAKEENKNAKEEGLEANE